MSGGVRGIALVLATVALGSCASVTADFGPGPGPYIGPDRVPSPRSSADMSAAQLELQRQAYALVGRSQLLVGNREFRYDCTGTVAAAYWGATGLDLYSVLAGYPGGGVEGLYHALEDQGLAGPTMKPQVGDLIFWDDTWDANGNGRWDDPLTHVGIVVETYPNGRVDFVHEHVELGIVIESMNLRERDTWTRKVNGKTVVVNAPMRMNGRPGMKKWLASQLFRAYGRPLLLGDSDS